MDMYQDSFSFVYLCVVQDWLVICCRFVQDVAVSSASKVSSVMVRHSHQPTDNRDKIKQWIREQGDYNKKP